MYILFQLIVAIIVGFCIMASELHRLKEENEKLKQQLKSYTNNDNTTEIKNNSTSQNSINTQKNIVQQQNLNNNKTSVNSQKAQISKQQMKNMLILISGAILIVLSAIVFLLSTWNTIPNLVKTFTLLLLIAVFLGASNIAQKRFKLKQTSKTFYYLAMIYIPIVLLSISTFELLGRYFSIKGDGKNIYFAISSVFLAVLYYFESDRNKSVTLNIFSDIFQVLSVIFGTCIFTTNYHAVISAILSLNIAKTLYLKKMKSKNNRQLHTIFSIIILGIITFLLADEIMFKLIVTKYEIMDVVNYSLLIFNYEIIKYLLGKKNKAVEIVFNEIINVLIIVTVLLLINLKNVILIPGCKLFVFSLASILVYSVNYIKNNHIAYKYIIYTIVYLLVISILQLFDIIKYVKYVPLVATFIAIISEIMKSDKNAKYFIITSYAISLICLNIGISLQSFFIILVSIFIFKLYKTANKWNEMLDIIPMIAIIPGVYISKIMMIGSFNFGIVLASFLIILETYKSLIKNKFNMNTVFSAIYIFLLIIAFDINPYINTAIVFIWAICHSKIKELNALCQIIGFISILVFYNMAVSDFSLNKITLIKCVGYILCIYAITRVTFKDIKELGKIIEYIATSIVYFVAMYLYSSLSDAMIFVLFMTVLIFIGYNKKIGPLFLTSLIAVVINVISLTRRFWLSIPWWGYMLLIGLSLILFAVRNEINQNNKKQTLADSLNKLKKKVEL